MADNESQRIGIVVAALLTTGIGTIVVGLRTVSRCFIIHNFGVDDSMMLAGWVFAVAYLVEIMLGVYHYGMGISGTLLTVSQMEGLLQDTMAVEVTYYCCVFFIKSSILLFYLRIAATRAFQICCRVTIAILAVFWVICLVVVFTQCIPLSKSWDIVGTVKGHCINLTAFFYSTSGFNIVTDIWILALPLRTLMRINRPQREKFALFIIFGMGIFSCISSIVRLYSIKVYTLSKDPFADAVPVNLWSIIEVNVAIVCASIPALKPLISKPQRIRTEQAIRGNRYYPGYKYYGKHSQSSSKDHSHGGPSNDGMKLEALSTFVQGGPAMGTKSLEHSEGSTENILPPVHREYGGSGIYCSREAKVEVEVVKVGRR